MSSSRVSGLNDLTDFHARSPYTLSRGRPEPRSAALLRRLFGITSHQRHGNIYPLCIGYAFPPRLSSRLTLGGLAFPRNPWACGGEVSRLTLATHASILTSVLSTALHRTASAYTESSPTTEKSVRRFGDMLEPRVLSAHVHSTSELLRTL